jgi:hypothetical protein
MRAACPTISYSLMIESPDMEGSSEWIEQAVADSRKGAVLQVLGWYGIMGELTASVTKPVLISQVASTDDAYLHSSSFLTP